MTGSSHREQTDVEFFNSPSCGNFFFTGIFPLNTDVITKVKEEVEEEKGEAEWELDGSFSDSDYSSFCTLKIIQCEVMEQRGDQNAKRIHVGWVSV